MTGGSLTYGDKPMSKFLPSILFTAILATAASPAAAEPLSFSRDGLEYTAEITKRENGVTKIVGYEHTRGERFVLFVKGDKVTGNYGSKSVAFSKAAAPETQLSSR